MKYGQFQNLSLASKLVLLVTVVSCLVLTFATTLLFWLEQRYDLAEVEQDLRALSEIADLPARSVLTGTDAGDGQTLARSLSLHHNLSSAFLLTADGRVLAGFVRRGEEGLNLGQTATLAELTRGCPGERLPRDGDPVLCGERLVLLRAVNADQKQIGFLCLQADYQHHHARSALFADAALTVFGGSGVIALILAFWLQRFLSRPIVEVTRAMGRVAGGDAAGLRLEPRGEDELGQLAAGFNDLLSRIEEREKTLAAAHDASRLQAQARLLTLEKALATTNVGVTITDLEGIIIYINPAEARMHGYAADELLGRRANCLGPEDLRQPFDLTNIRTWQRETLNQRRDGTLFPVRLVSDLVLEENGHPLAVITLCEDITERRETERDLLIKDRAIASSLSAIAIGDLGGRLTYVNNAFLRMWGCRHPDEVLGKPPEAFFASAEVVGAAVAAMLEKGSWQGELSARRRDDSVFEVLGSGSMVFGEGNQPLCLMAAFIDISERKRAEEQLLQERLKLEQYGKLFQYISEMVVVVGTDGLFKDFNPAFARTLGYADEELKNKPLVELIHPDDRQPTLDELTKQMQGQVETVNFENRYLCKSGVLHWFSWNAYYVEEERLFYGIARDITDRKASEQALQLSEERFRQMVDLLPQPVFETDAAGRLIFANRTAFETFGYSQDDLDRGLSALETVLPAEREDALPNLLRVLGGERIGPVERSMVDGQGHSFPALIYAAPILKDGYPAGMRGLIIDISGRKQVEEQIRTSLQEKEVLLREIHHRVKNNLQVISSLLNLQQNNNEDPRSRREFNALRYRIRAMASIHERLYQSPNLARIDFAPYLREFGFQLYRLFGVRADEVRLEFDLEEISLDVDIAVPCGLIVNELLTNIFKYAFPDGRRGRAAVQLRADGTTMVLTVEDDGIGLPDHINPLKTETLGLTLVSNLAKQLGATISFEGTVGTRAVLRSPCRQEREERSAVGQSAAGGMEPV